MASSHTGAKDPLAGMAHSEAHYFNRYAPTSLLGLELEEEIC